jgi:hypothetical protein
MATKRKSKNENYLDLLRFHTKRKGIQHLENLIARQSVLQKLRLGLLKELRG